jgi:hypothetical protein
MHSQDKEGMPARHDRALSHAGACKAGGGGLSIVCRPLGLFLVLVHSGVLYEPQVRLIHSRVIFQRGFVYFFDAKLSYLCNAYMPPGSRHAIFARELTSLLELLDAS